MDEFERVLREQGADLSALSYVKKVRELTRMTMLASAPQPASVSDAGSGGFRGFSSLSSRLTDRLKDSGLENLCRASRTSCRHRRISPSRGAGGIADGAQQCGCAGAERNGRVPVFRPQGTARSSRRIGGVKARQVFNEAIVFVVGGGGYVEFANLQEYAARTAGAAASAGPAAANAVGAVGGGKKITYGATEILKPIDFVRALAHLAGGDVAASISSTQSTAAAAK